MTLIEKLDKQQQNNTKIYLFKEGVFYKAYNEGAFLLQELNYTTLVKHNKKTKTSYVSIGFPASVFEKLKTKYHFSAQTIEEMYVSNPVVFDTQAYNTWCAAMLQKYKANNNSVDNSTIIDQLKQYPLATKTPMEVFMWLHELKLGMP